MLGMNLAILIVLLLRYFNFFVSSLYLKEVYTSFLSMTMYRFLENEVWVHTISMFSMKMFICHYHPHPR
jgi:hypothetical protein